MKSMCWQKNFKRENKSHSISCSVPWQFDDFKIEITQPMFEIGSHQFLDSLEVVNPWVHITSQHRGLVSGNETVGNVEVNSFSFGIGYLIITEVLNGGDVGEGSTVK